MYQATKKMARPRQRFATLNNTSIPLQGLVRVDIIHFPQFKRVAREERADNGTDTDDGADDPVNHQEYVVCFFPRAGFRLSGDTRTGSPVHSENRTIQPSKRGKLPRNWLNRI